MRADPATVPLVRRRVISMLRANQWEEQGIDEAALMTTELATNAVEHAHTPYTLTVDVTNRTLRVDVRDASTCPPTVGAASPDALGGRGLMLVAALADRWGYNTMTGGKSVWFEVEPSVD